MQNQNIWKIADNGTKVYATDVAYSDGVVSFTANHLSLYAIGYDSSNDDSPDNGTNDDSSDDKNDSSMLMYAGVGIVAIIAILGLVMIVRRKA